MKFQGGVRAQKLNEVRTLSEFRIGETGMKVQLYEIWSDPETGLAWIDCYNGTFRLPARLFDWAEEVESQAHQVVGHRDLFPCWSVFTEDAATGEILVEIFPHGYKSPFRR
ncbi:hypothetical protein [Streptomyces sp. NPDC057002]|uniref:hypothetical protein n=1 Tax=Streptomyces sp. NPDC057002 TaxID=3345992 RepID=UPI00362500A1